MDIRSLSRTSESRLVGAVRLALGFIFFLAGILKVVVPSLGAAFAGQLAAAGIPLADLNFYVFPVIEMVLGVMLFVGLHSRLSALVAAFSMVVATYVHLVADDPSLFPLQPVEPIGPLVLLAGLLYLVWKGAGAWSIDLHETLGSDPKL